MIIIINLWDHINVFKKIRRSKNFKNLKQNLKRVVSWFFDILHNRHLERFINPKRMVDILVISMTSLQIKDLDKL